MVILVTMLWSLLNAVGAGDLKAVIAYSTVSQISYMFVALVSSPMLCLYHIIIHALFKSLLFLASGSLIHIHHHHQSTHKIKTRHSTFIKAAYLFTASVLLLSTTKETIVYSSASSFASLFSFFILVLGALLTALYSFNLYARCFRFSFHSSLSLIRTRQQPCSYIFTLPLFAYHSFAVPFLVLSSLFIDYSLEYTINTATGTLFFAFNPGAVLACAITDEHFTIVCLAVPLLVVRSFHSLSFLSFDARTRQQPCSSLFFCCFSHFTPSSSAVSALETPLFQDLFILASSCFAQGPANLLEVMACLNCCYNLHHIHYYNILFIACFLLAFVFTFHFL
jgi:NADH:ubiquinone oxidoreductase subunit 5 (subunit L)/multisubunit Na+/H+ antiporter MnhA subunit